MPDTGVEVQAVPMDLPGMRKGDLVVSDASGRHRILSEWHAALLDALAREAGAVEVQIEDDQGSDFDIHFDAVPVANEWFVPAGKYLVIPMEGSDDGDA